MRSNGEGSKQRSGSSVHRVPLTVCGRHMGSVGGVRSREGTKLGKCGAKELRGGGRE